MLPSSLQGDDGVGVGTSLLQVVGRAVVEDWSTRPEHHFLGHGGIGELVDDVVRAVEACRATEEPSIFVGEIPDRYVYHRVVQEIRARLLFLWAEGRPTFSDSDASDVLEIASCLERIRLELWPEDEEDFTSRLSGPDTVNLLVEVAHDMRSPLSSILFLSETMRASRSGEVSELQKQQLGLIYGAALGLLSITNDVVDAARRGGGLLGEEPSSFSLTDVFDSIRELVHPVAEEKGLTLEFRGPDRDYFRGHPMVLTRVLLNLVTNALKFTDEGGVTVAAKRVDRTILEFAVTDTGRGMTEDEIDRLFRPFQKSEYRSGHFFSSSGLGLTIARQLLASIESKLEIQSTVGEGTRSSFRVDLPRVPAH